MDLLVGPVEHRMIKNVAAMMFCKNQAKFFPVTQVDIVIFPDGCIKNPNNMFLNLASIHQNDKFQNTFFSFSLEE